MLAAPFFLSFFWVLGFVTAAPSWTSSPLEPASIPLAVRSPYSQAWLAGGHALSESWPTFWTGGPFSWAGYARVDGVAYRTMGLAGIEGAEVAQQTSVSVNASSTHFVLIAGGVELLYTFVSPVEPTDLAKQSLPLSYMSVTARAVDGRAHEVQVYADISAEWVSGDVQKTANWSLEKTADGRVLAHKVQLANEELFTEVDDRIEHGSAYLATTQSASLTFAQGADIDTRKDFVANGRLSGLLDTNFRAISDNWPVFAFASSLGSVAATGVQAPPFVLALGHIRDPVVQYVTKAGMQTRSPLWMTKWGSALDAISAFLGDYDQALAAAGTLDARISRDGINGASDNYASLLRLSLRQALATFELTVSKKADGSLDATDILAFMKEVSSNGNMNTVDVIFPFWPLVLYANPALGKYLLEPIFKYQSTGLYPNKYAVHDLGAHYPNATGHNDGQDEPMPLEESGNMIVMALSYAQRTGDKSQIQQYSALLAQWTQFLISNALVPASQISTDDFAGALGNQTNLAVKGIIGIAAMGEIMKLNGDSARADTYTSFAKDYVTRFRALATSRDKSHLKLSYGDDASWGLVYNLYADKLLGLNLFPQDLYDTQTAWYKTKMDNFGIALDTRHSYTKSDWQIWTAAIADDDLKGALVDAVLRYAGTSDINSGAPLSDWYDAKNGSTVGFRARPVVGGHFAVLGLQKDMSLSGDSSSAGGSTTGGTGGSGTDDGTDGDGLDLNGDGAAASLSASRNLAAALVLCAVGSLVYL
ncbi:DUF1793-domain-containing protein [Exidia glandulosa HHB12029]|uniref:DUF1793-domain-containing protein n=1 Tax=Exidia glandulosa HHB12029 TaxID=1314781 RepID=A0A165LRB8_EXIGL|nr:DUF1793-domain-containing protein [Exidia glandulosa HHB12029]